MIRRELLVFLIVGSLTVLLDFLSYRGLMWTGLANIEIAKAAGFIVGTVFAYFANRAFTFGHRTPARGSGWRFALLYAVSLSANVSLNALVLHLLVGMAMVVQGAFLVATGVSTVFNFLGMKFFVFRGSRSLETP